MATLKHPTAHLKVGNHFPDPHHTAKVQGVDYVGTPKHVERHDTQQSSRPVDGKLGDDLDDRGPMLHRPMDPATKVNTYTSGSGSKRD
jgi:hypothetical protein